MLSSGRVTSGVVLSGLWLLALGAAQAQVAAPPKAQSKELTPQADDPGAAAVDPASGPRVQALVIGISNYPRDAALGCAAFDAVEFADFLRTTRGGEANPVIELIDQDGSRGKILHGLGFFTLDPPPERVRIFFSGHGVYGPDGQPYLVPHSERPIGENLAEAALPVWEPVSFIEGWITRLARLSPYLYNEIRRRGVQSARGAPTSLLGWVDRIRQQGSEVELYIDACHAGKIGEAPVNKSIHPELSDFVRSKQGDPVGLVGFLSSQGDQKSWECADWRHPDDAARSDAACHGAFTYALLSGLRGWRGVDGRPVAQARRERMTGSELSDFLTLNVGELTSNQQDAVAFGPLADHSVVLGALGGALPATTPALVRAPSCLPPGRDKAVDRAFSRNPPDWAAQGLTETQILFRRALFEDRPDAAEALLPALEREVPPGDFRDERGRLGAAFATAGERVLHEYLLGEQRPQTQDLFARGLAAFEKARLHLGDSSERQSRIAFLRARVATFDAASAEEWAAVEDDYYQALALYPNSAYTWNGLGLALLEQARYALAVQAFEAARLLAPGWAYPLHNLALAYEQQGAFQQAEATYREAMAAGPGYAYVPYNLGLLYRRLHRLDDAERLLARSRELTSGIDDPALRARHASMTLNALGTVQLAKGDLDAAIDDFAAAIDGDPELPEARHNLAVATLEKDPSRLDEAVTLWRRNVAAPAAYLPSSWSLFQALAGAGRWPQALAAYRELTNRLAAERLDRRPAALELAALFLDSGSAQSDEAVLEAVAQDLAPSCGPALAAAEDCRLLGDALMALDRPGPARESYERGLDSRPDRKLRRLLRRRLRGL